MKFVRFVRGIRTNFKISEAERERIRIEEFARAQKEFEAARKLARRRQSIGRVKRAFKILLALLSAGYGLFFAASHGWLHFAI